MHFGQIYALTVFVLFVFLLKLHLSRANIASRKILCDIILFPVALHISEFFKRFLMRRIFLVRRILLSIVMALPLGDQVACPRVSNRRAYTGPDLRRTLDRERQPQKSRLAR